MLIRATRKLLNISRIKPQKGIESEAGLPGAWYADTLSLKKPGKMGVFFLHDPTLITILVPGKSLHKVIPSLTSKVSHYLARHGFSALEPLFDLESNVEVYPTASRKMLGYMNHMKYTLEYHMASAADVASINFEYIEDLFIDYLYTLKSMTHYTKPRKLLEEELKQL